MKRSCLIVAGGQGSRMEHELPKQFIPLAGVPILMHTLRKLHAFDREMQLIVVLPAAEIERWDALCLQHQFTIKHQVVVGGEQRFDSVKNGLAHVTTADLIAVHDGVRPLVSRATLERCFEGASQYGSAIPVLPAHESVREGTMDQSNPVDRSRYFLVQTPQIFRANILVESYHQASNAHFTDDASVVEQAGIPVHLVLGNRENMKITFPEDLELAGFLLTKSDLLA